PDREHDPALDLLAPPRDRGDEARRRDELVRARAVHGRRTPLRPRGCRARNLLPDPRQGDRLAGDAPQRALERSRRARARLPPDGVDPARNGARPGRGRVRAPPAPLPQGLTGSDTVVVEVARRGKLVVGDPYFTPGVPLVLDHKGLGAIGPGDLALVR